MKALIIGIILLVVGGGLLFWYVGVINTEQELRNRFEAQDQVVGEFYGNMFAILKQKAGVTDEYRNSFKDIYTGLIEGRYQGEGQGALMKWVQESNPTIDASVFKDLMASIEGLRNNFFIEQKKMTDIVKQHKDLRTLLPTSFIVGDKEALVYEPILPVDAKKVIESREETEEDLKLF